MSTAKPKVGEIQHNAYVLFGCHHWLIALSAAEITGLLSSEAFTLEQQLPSGPFSIRQQGGGLVQVGFDVGLLMGAEQPAGGPAVLLPWTFPQGSGHVLLRCGQQLMATALPDLLPLPKNCFRQRGAALQGAFVTPPAYQERFGPYGLCIYGKRLWTRPEFDQAMTLLSPSEQALLAPQVGRAEGINPTS